jgi:hypothetical protein
MTSQDILFQNLDADVPIECIDTDARFSVADVEHSQTINHEEALGNMIKEWDAVDSRQLVPDTGGRARSVPGRPGGNARQPRTIVLGHVPSDIEHESHQCDAQDYPIPCQLCKRVCSSSDHLHALDEGAVHLCGYVVRCGYRGCKVKCFL